MENLEVVKSAEIQQAESPTPMYITLEQLIQRNNSGESIKDILEIKSYLPINYKQVLINNLILNSKEVDENGLVKINYCHLELFKTLLIVEFYTNLLLEHDDIINDFDYLMENKIIDLIYNEVDKSDLGRIDMLIEKEIEQIIKLSNSIEGIFSNNLNKLQDKIDVIINKIPDVDSGSIEKWITKLAKSIKSFSPEKFEQLNEMVKIAKGGK